jgi:hypothetical protein
MICPHCHLASRVRVFPYRCRCGKVHQGASKPRRKPIDPLACIHRGDSIGEIDCGCEGKPQAYQCGIHGECMIRKLKPGPIRLVGGEAIKPASCNSCSDRQPFDPTEVALITFHWNPHGFRRLRETFYEWRPAINHPVTCYEMAIGDAEPEIEGSIVIRGDSRHLMWQKERLINLAIEQLPAEVKYVGWIDHDMVPGNTGWLAESIELLASGVDAVQPFEAIRFLNQEGAVIQTSPGGVATVKAGKPPKTCPGAAWIARRDFFDRIGGMYERNIVGGGDAVWFFGITGRETRFLSRQSDALASDARQWVDGLQGATCDYVPGSLTHLWHGDRKNRQYLSRDEIVRRHQFDPSTHVEIDPDNGLLRWTDAAPAALRADVREYFAARRDDG